MKKTYLAKNPSQTKQIGKRLAQKILKGKPQKTASVVKLFGDLGAGKTTFLQGFAKGLEIKEKILSPTFVLMRKIRLGKSKGKDSSASFKYFYHIDCYRIKEGKDLLDLGLKEIISQPENIIAIEWAEKAKEALPENALSVTIGYLDKTQEASKNHRCIIIKS